MKKATFLLAILFITLFCFASCASNKADVDSDDSQIDIHKLIQEGRSSEARALFQVKVDINAVDEFGNTPLHAAARVNDYDLVSFLVYRGAETEIKNQEGDTPLHVAIKNNSVKSAEILAALSSNIFAKDGDGFSALELGISRGPEFYESLITTKTGEIRDTQGRTIVHYFAEWENIDALNLCIKKAIPVSAADTNGVTPLEICYRRTESLTSARMAASLILADAVPIRGKFSYFEDVVKTRNPSLRFDDGQTPLHMATILGHTGIVRYLIEKGASITAKDISGATPLHEAVRYGRTEIARLLLEAGADANAQDSLGKTPLLITTPQGARTELYTMLLRYGSNPNAKDLYGDTPLHIATITGMDITILSKLVSAGADIDGRNKRGVTPLAVAVEHQWGDHINFYASRGADIHAEDMEGKTPLTRALDAGLDVTMKLINSKNASARDSFGNTPLHIAVRRGADPTQVRYILDQGADINARNRNGDSPLYIAVQNNLRAVGEMLLTRNADVFSTNTENYSPLRLAFAAGGDVQDWILTSEVIKATDGIGNTPLHYAAEWKQDNAVKALLEKGSKPNAQNANGESPLFSAVKSDNESTIDLLLKNGANKNQRDYLGNTALHASVRWDAKKAAQKLIYTGININAQNMSGKSPLHEAARAGHTAMVNLLIDNGADINATDATGKTVLIDSIQSGNTDLVKLLIYRGASPLIQEMYGRNAYHAAAESGNIALINIIREAGGNALSRDTHGKTPFSLVLDKSEEVIKAVLGSNLNLSDSDGNTPIHIAVAGRVSYSKLSMLIAMRYPLNRRNSLGQTPLSLAVSTNQIDNAKVLLENGADPFITDNSGECALSSAIKNNPEILNCIVQAIGNEKDMAGDGILHYAAKTANADTVKKLISMGIDRTLKNISGETPYDIAVRWQRPQDVIEALK